MQDESRNLNLECCQSTFFILDGVRKKVNPPYGCTNTEDLFAFNTAIAALEVQGVRLT